MTLDPTRGFMVPYGTGVVSNDGTQFIANPDPSHPGHNYGLVHFDWHGPSAPPPNNNNPSPEGCGGTGGGPNPPACQIAGPVDVSSGIVSYRSTDLPINGGRGSITVTRVYRTLSSNLGPFGIGTSHNYGYSLNTLAYIDGGATITLAVPDGNQFTFSQTQGGTFVNTSIPSLRGAVLTANGRSGPYVLRWADGSQYQFTVFTSLGSAGAFLTSITDLNGNTTNLSLNPAQPTQLLQVTDPVGRSLNLTYDSSNRIIAISDPIGRKVSYTYNSQGTLATFTDAAGGVTQYTYDVQNNLATITDPRGVITEQNTYNEDFDGRLIQQIAADGGVYSFNYALQNPTVPTSPVLQTIVTDPLGNQTTYRFNTQRLLVSVTDPAGQIRTLARNPDHNNLVTAYSGAGVCPVCGDPRRGNVHFTFDVLGNVLSLTDSMGNTSSFTYDPRFNKVATVTDPLHHLSQFTYDTSGNLLTIVDPNGNTTTFSYDSLGQLLQMTDALGKKTKFAYDAFGNRIETIDALGNVTTTTFDANSRPVRVTDGLGRTSTATYDVMDDVVQITNAQGHSTHFTYDAVGNLLSVTDANGNSITYTYDAKNRLLTRTDPLGHRESRTYDKDGNLIGFIDRRNQTSAFTYDVLNRVVTEAYQDGASVAKSYDLNSRLISVTDSAAGSFAFSYDSDGRILTQTNPEGSISYAYDAVGRITSRSVAGQATAAYAYDSSGDLLSASVAQAALDLSYDTVGKVVGVTRQNGITSNFAYDVAGRLLSVMHSGGQNVQVGLGYTYDPVNERVSASGVGGQLATQPSATTYNSADEPVSQSGSSGSTSYSFDADGNMTSATGAAGTTSYTWDSRNRLTAISAPGESADLTYDFLGNLISEQLTTSGTTVTRSFLVDQFSNIAFIAQSGGDNLLVLTGNGIDQHFAVIHTSGDVEYGLTDALNSTIGTVNAQGALTSVLVYDPFGATTTSDTLFPFQFTGRLAIGNSLYYYRARYYDPYLRRFLSEDPVEIHGGDVNPYPYAANDPINLTDPTGRIFWIPVIVAGAGAVIGGFTEGYKSYECGGRGWELAGAVARGAVSGAASALVGLAVGVLSGPVFGSISGGAAASLSNDVFNGLLGGDFSWEQTGIDTFFGGVFGKFGEFLGPTVRGGSNFNPLTSPRTFGPKAQQLYAQSGISSLLGLDRDINNANSAKCGCK